MITTKFLFLRIGLECPTQHEKKMNRIIRRIPRRIKFYCQRAKRGFADEDLWSLDYFLAGVISKSIRELIKQKRGYPAEMTEEEYDGKLMKIVEGFEGYLKWEDNGLSILKFEGEPEDGSQNKFDDLIKDGALLIEKKEFTKESIEEYERVKEETFNKLSESFRLLEELFPSLWD